MTDRHYSSQRKRGATAVDTVKPAQPTSDFVDTGSLNNDGITYNGVITVNNLEVGATWQYSISDDNGFVDGRPVSTKSNIGRSGGHPVLETKTVIVILY